MKKENIEEGVKRIAILIWLVWVAYWLFLHIGYPDYGSWNCENYIYLTSAEHPIYLTNPMKAFHSYERTSWVDFWILNGCLFQSFRAAFYALTNLVVVTIVAPAIIYFPVVFIWGGFTKNWDDKNK